MAMTPCGECGADVSQSARSCPRCGATGKQLRPKVKRPMSLAAKAAIAVFALSFIAVAAMQQPGPPRQTPVQAREEQAHQARISSVVAAASALKQSLRNPASLTYDKILVSENADTVCIRYRARNGFGDMNREHAAFSRTSGTTSVSAWNRRCAHASLYNVTDTITEYLQMFGK